MSSDFNALLEEYLPELRPQRRNLRFPADGDAPPVRLCGIQGEAVGTLANESFSGIAALIEQSPSIAVGNEVDVEYFGQPMKATVRRIVPQEEGWWLVGLEWK